MFLEVSILLGRVDLRFLKDRGLGQWFGRVRLKILFVQDTCHLMHLSLVLFARLLPLPFNTQTRISREETRLYRSRLCGLKRRYRLVYLT